jgi:hypothetical protein
MGTIGVPAGILLAVAVGAVCMVLRWAAVVRGGIHHQFVRRRLHVTMSAVAGCGMA